MTALARELEAWRQAGLLATLWWRDDDAGASCPRLEALLGLARRLAAPVSLAAIPVQADERLAALLGQYPGASVLTHGFRHVNHAPPGEKKREFGAERPLDLMLAELGAARARLAAVLPGALPVLVPPWNRIAEALPPRLAEAGYRALSAFGPRPSAPAIPTLNTHIDACDWRSGGRFIGEEALDEALARELSRRRAALASEGPDRAFDACEPTGLLTHHARLDGEAFASLGRVIARVGESTAGRWLSFSEALRF